MIDASKLVGAIKSTRGGLIVDGHIVPLEDIGTLMLGNHTTISGGALTMLAKYQVVLLNCQWNGIPDLVGYSWSANTRVGARHRAQAALSLPRTKAAWQAIVRAKIAGQAANLAVAGLPGAERLLRLCKETRSGDTTACEAQAARLYWASGIVGGQGFTRQPGGADSPNSLLNYGYTVLRGAVIQGITAAGLWPTLGLWHRHRSNSHALADDLIEPFRPAVDWAVHRLEPQASLDDQPAKRALVGVVGLYLSEQAQTIYTEISNLASQFGRYVEGAEAQLTVPSWIPPAELTESD